MSLRKAMAVLPAGALLVAGLVVMSPLTSQAADGDIYSESDLFNRLRLNTLDEPDGAAERAAKQPYGTNAVQIMTVNELYTGYTFNNDDRTIIVGDGWRPGQTFGTAKPATPTGNWRNCIAVAAAEGNFGGAVEGRQDAVAVLSVYHSYTGYWVFELWVEGLAGTTGSRFLGEVARIPVTAFPERLLQQNLHIATGDVNGDGLDEIVLLAPLQETRNMTVY
ncbi:MAG: hypothetical protein FWD29_09590, partial [Micrococcales bacterium]|nr:hypothetical protein [Micrococcales bacterium]